MGTDVLFNVSDLYKSEDQEDEVNLEYSGPDESQQCKKGIDSNSEETNGILKT